MQYIPHVIHILLKHKVIENYETSAIGLDKWKDYVTSFGFGNFLGYDHPTGKDLF